MNKKTGRSFGFVVVIAVAAFFGFQPLFSLLKDAAAQQFAAAIFGTIFAAVITMTLLSKQSEAEEEKERGQKVFEERVGLFNEILTRFEEMIQKNSIKVESLQQMQFLAMRLVMLASDSIIEKYLELYQHIAVSAESGNNDGQGTNDDEASIEVTPELRIKLFELSLYFRQELGLAATKTRQIDQIFNKIKKSNDALEQTKAMVKSGRGAYLSDQKTWLALQAGKGYGAEAELSVKIFNDIVASLKSKGLELPFPISYLGAGLSLSAPVKGKEGKSKVFMYLYFTGKTNMLKIWKVAYEEILDRLPPETIKPDKKGYRASYLVTSWADYKQNLDAILVYQHRNYDLAQNGKMLKPLSTGEKDEIDPA